MDKSWFLDIENFARHTAWAHGFMAGYALYGGVAFLAFLVLVAWWRARSDGRAPNAVAAVLWVAIGTVIAFGIAQPINHAVAEMRPYYHLHGVELLVPKAHDFSFPSDHATIAGAVIAGLWLTGRDRWLAGVATVAGLFLAFARVYVGAHYPFDVVGGLVLGALVVLILWPLGMLILRWVTRLVDRSPFRLLVQAGSRA
ncbi:MAG: phosphatase PAP2 family protein [Acidimicrobiales bacterium]